MSKGSHLLDSHLKRLANIEPTLMRVISLYVDTQPDQHVRAGRGRQGDAVDQASHRQKFTEEEARRPHGWKDSGGRTSLEYEKRNKNKVPPVPDGQGKGDPDLQQLQRSPRRGARSGRKARPDVKAGRERTDS